MKCRFKTNKILTAARETKHTLTTADGKTIQKKLASNPLKRFRRQRFSHQRKRRRQESQLKDAPDAAASAAKNYVTPTKE